MEGDGEAGVFLAGFPEPVRPLVGDCGSSSGPVIGGFLRIPIAASLSFPRSPYFSYSRLLNQLRSVDNRWKVCGSQLRRGARLEVLHVSYFSHRR
jgi:hypothetical protein